MSNRPVSIVVLTKYQEIFSPFVESWTNYCSSFPVVVVRDGENVNIDTNWPKNFSLVQGPEQFQMAGNGNLGLKAVPSDHDVLYCGDDIRFIEKDTIERLQKIAYECPEVGMLSPKLIGRGSPLLVDPPKRVTYSPPLQFFFPCVYIKRELIDKIGYLDERFNDFGSDDLDYCIRTKLAGYELAITNEVSVIHEGSPEGGPTTFVKKLGVQEWKKQEFLAFEKIRRKYGVDKVTFDKCIQTGNVGPLIKSSEPQKVIDQNSTKEEQLAYLKSRYIFIATPAYGGWVGTNYTNSLLGLINLCHNIGIKYTVSFMHNESLITRARNIMVRDFLTKTDATDFFFIDADISFNPNDIVTLLFHPEEVIAVACAKKGLRLDRVFEAGKANGKVYSQEELEALCGDFVLNFPPGEAPPAINLGQLLEVQDAGTGLMYIKREVFTKFAEAYPDRWYMPLIGEHDADKAVPVFMYFQSRIDTESAKYNLGGLPHYISEDYAFTRDCRKIGIKVYIAPWIKSSHMGSYHFKGDMMAIAQSGGKLR